MKPDIPYFDDHLHIEDHLDWERFVEMFLDYMEIQLERQVKVACKFRGGAGAWWNQFTQARLKEAKGLILAKDEETPVQSLLSLRF